MFPEITLFQKIIPTYGIMAVVGFALGFLYICRTSAAYKLDREDSIYIYVLGLVGAILGAKALYLVTVLPSFLHDLPLISSQFDVFKGRYLTGGMVLYGGLFGGILLSYHTARQYHDRLSDFFPVLLPATAIVSGCGRIGCFLTGCCYGKETSSWIGVVFQRSRIAPTGVRLIPVQLFEAAFDFVLCCVIIEVCRREKYRAKALKIYLLLYAAFRFGIEFFRGDAIRGVMFGLSTSQWISLAVIIGIGILSAEEYRKSKKLKSA